MNDLLNIIRSFLLNIPYIYFIIFAFAFLFLIICYCFIYKKAGYKWYYYFIPIYNVIILFKIANLSLVNILLFLIPIVFIGFISYLASIVSVWMLIINVLPVLCLLYILIKIHIGIAHKFNKSTLYGIFMLIIPFNIILLPLIAFSKKKAYVENKISFKANVQSNNSVYIKEEKKVVCSKCGKQLGENAIYCTSCEAYID